MKTASIIFWVIVVAFIGWFARDRFLERRVESQKARKRIERKQQTDSRVSEMVTRYNAIANWRDSLKTKGQTIFSVDVESSLTSSNRPVLFYGHIDDVFKKDSKYFVHISNPEDVNLDIHWVLECGPDLLATIRSNSNHFIDHYAVVASITDVKKPTLEAESVSSDSDSRDIDLASPDNTFIARGRCLDLMFVSAWE